MKDEFLLAQAAGAGWDYGKLCAKNAPSFPQSHPLLLFMNKMDEKKKPKPALLS
jgi:hypothetical protein